MFGNYNGLDDPKRGHAVAQSHAANHVLASLGAENTAALLPHLKIVDLPQETVLFEAGDTIETVYFPLSGVVSVVVDLANGEMIEAAMIGRDSLLGGSAAFDNQISLNRVVVQVAGTAAALNVNRICELAQQSELFRAKLARHEQFLLAQAQQSAACNATHILEARLCRWLLRCRDLLESGDIPFTQEFLAEMLGVRRTSVTVVAKALRMLWNDQGSRGTVAGYDLPRGWLEFSNKFPSHVRNRTERAPLGLKERPKVPRSTGVSSAFASRTVPANSAARPR
jgi:CRP-like cAMP-binding protein